MFRGPGYEQDKRDAAFWSRSGSLPAAKARFTSYPTQARPIMNGKEEVTAQDVLRLPVQGMTCASCVATLEKSLQELEGVERVAVNLASETALVGFQSDRVGLSELTQQVRRCGFEVPTTTTDLVVEKGMNDVADAARVKEVLEGLDGVQEAVVSPDSGEVQVIAVAGSPVISSWIGALNKAGYQSRRQERSLEEEQPDSSPEQSRQLRKFVWGVVLTTPLFLLSMTRDLGVWGNWAHWLGVDVIFALLATPVQFYVGQDYYRGALAAWRNRSATMDTLVALGSSVAYFFSLATLFDLAWGDGGLGRHVYFETSALIITLIKLGKLLEIKARGRANQAIRRLLSLRPPVARVVEGSEVLQVPLEAVSVGQMLRVHPGEQVPLDGVVVVGHSAVDESMITGETVPVAKQPGDPVVGGTLNQQGLLVLRVTRVGSDTTLARIIRLVDQTQSGRARIQKLVDRVAAVFVPVVLAVALTTFLVWWLLADSGLELGLLRAVAVLVIACPCALGLATPTAVVVAAGRGAELGILFRNTDVLERSGSLRAILLDKTGTLTPGTPVVTDVLASTPAQELEVLRWAAAAERASSHPLATALVDHARSMKLELEMPSSLQSFPGQGIEAKIRGMKVVVGRFEWLQQRGAKVSSWSAAVSRLEREAKTVMAVEVAGAIVGLIAMADRLRPEAPAALEQLRDMGLEVGMVTGDNEITARSLARSLGMEQVLSEVMPEEKVELVKKWQQSGKGPVAMVGDGINDAPALAQSDLGIAMGRGSDVAIEAADISLLREDLKLVPRAIRLSRLTLRIIRQNLFWAFFYNIVLIPVAAGVLYPLSGLPPILRSLHPGLAAAAMAFSSLSVVANSLRIRRWRE